MTHRSSTWLQIVLSIDRSMNPPIAATLERFPAALKPRCRCFVVPLRCSWPSPTWCSGPRSRARTGRSASASGRRTPSTSTPRGTETAGREGRSAAEARARRHASARSALHQQLPAEVGKLCLQRSVFCVQTAFQAQPGRPQVSRLSCWSWM